METNPNLVIPALGTQVFYCDPERGVFPAFVSGLRNSEVGLIDLSYWDALWVPEGQGVPDDYEPPSVEEGVSAYLLRRAVARGGGIVSGTPEPEPPGRLIQAAGVPHVSRSGKDTRCWWMTGDATG